MTADRIKCVLDQHGIESIEQDGAIAALQPIAHHLGEWRLFDWITTAGELYAWLGY